TDRAGRGSPDRAGRGSPDPVHRQLEEFLDETPPGVELQGAGRTYVLLALAALVVMILALIERGLVFWALFPALVGSSTLALRWKMSVPLLLVTLGGLLFVDGYQQMGWRYWQISQAYPLSNVLLAGAVFVYAA